MAFVPGQPDRITFELPDIAHTFRRGHRVKKFMDIPKSRDTDFEKATQKVLLGGSRIELHIRD